MQLDPSSMRATDVYHLLTSVIVPRPIAWVGTRSAAGQDNLAPFSYFMGVSSRPPALAISVARLRGGLLKHTAQNILETQVFTVSTVHTDAAHAMCLTSGSWPDSEYAHAGLVPTPAQKIPCAYPSAAKISMECRLIHSHDMGSTHLLVGEIILFHCDEDVIVRPPDGPMTADIDRLDPLARLGGQDYTRIGEMFRMPPPLVQS